jgi:acetyltransferase-like isoleucine patch superfamily enzyme
VAVSVERLKGITWAKVRRKVDNELRARRLAANSARVLVPPPPSAFASFGEGSVIGPPARVTMPEAIHIGNGVIIHEHAWISVVDAVPGYTPKLTIGDGTHIDRLCHIACVGEIEIGPDVLCGERVLIGDTYHGYEDPDLPIIKQPMATPQNVRIERGVFIGLGVLIMAGVTVGEHAYLGAGSVVTRDVPPRTVVVGNPARPVRRYNSDTGAWESCS